MNEKDKEAFDVWLKINIKNASVSDIGKIFFITDFSKVWQSACDYKQKEIEARKSELEYAAKILTDVQADKLEMRGQIQKLEAENAKLRECVEFYANQENWMGYHRDVDCMPYDTEPAKALSDGFDILLGGKRARQVLKELDGK